MDGNYFKFLGIWRIHEAIRLSATSVTTIRTKSGGALTRLCLVPVQNWRFPTAYRETHPG